MSSAPQPTTNCSEARVVGNLVFASSQIATDFETGIPPEARINPKYPFYGSDTKLQARYVLENLKKTFEAADSSLHNTVKAQVFMQDLRDFHEFDEVWREYFGEDVPPRTTVGTSGLSVPGVRFSVDLIGHTNNVDHDMISTEDGVRPMANYAEAIRVGNWVFPAGHVANDYPNGIPPEAVADPAMPHFGSNIERQTRYILDRMQETLVAANSSLANAVKAQVFMHDLMDFDAMDAVWREYFGENRPTRSTVACPAFLGCGEPQLLEIDLICHTNDVDKRYVVSDNLKPLANYAEAIAVDGLLSTAGVTAADWKIGMPPEALKHYWFPFYGQSIRLETNYSLGLLKKSFEAAGSSLENVVKATIFLTDINDFYSFDQVWAEWFDEPYPARTVIQVPYLMIKDARIEIDLWGTVPA